MTTFVNFLAIVFNTLLIILLTISMIFIQAVQVYYQINNVDAKLTFWHNRYNQGDPNHDGHHPVPPKGRMDHTKDYSDDKCQTRDLVNEIVHLPSDWSLLVAPRARC